MKPRIVDKEPFAVLGITAHGKPSEFNYGEIWNRFMSQYFNKIKQFSIDKAYYGVYFGEQGTELVDLVVGMAVANVGGIPDGLVLREIPSAHYAVFECKMESISQTWGYIYGEWFPTSGYEHDKNYDFEYFPPDGSEAGSPVYIHVPIKPEK